MPPKRKRLLAEAAIGGPDVADHDDKYDGLVPIPALTLSPTVSRVAATVLRASTAAVRFAAALDEATQALDSAGLVDPLHSALRKALEDATASASTLSRVVGSLPPLNSPLPVSSTRPVLALAQARPVATRPLGAPELRLRAGATSQTECELLNVVSSHIAARSLIGQAQGLPARGPAPAIPPACTNVLGCWLSQSRAQQNGGHTQMSPLFPRLSSRAPNGAGAVSQRRSPQLVHRLSVRAWGSWESLQHMFEDGWEVSHLCHQPACFNPDHLAVESHAANMTRKQCSSGTGCARVCKCSPSCLV